MASGDLRAEKYITLAVPMSKIQEAMQIARGTGRLKIIVKP